MIGSCVGRCKRGRPPADLVGVLQRRTDQEHVMAEVLIEFSEPVIGEDGTRYGARACGGPMDNERWQGWIEFLPLDGGEPLRSPRETTQPNRVDTLYWATGLTAVYLEGALKRTLRPIARRVNAGPAAPAFDAPAPAESDFDDSAPVAADSVLNPFSVYRKGETLLRQQLGALSPWHLVNIIRDYELSSLSTRELEAMDGPALQELIVRAVRANTDPQLTR
jgi:hypothetical protein